MADRIEREIEEILRKLDNFVPDRARRPARKVGQPFAAAQGWFSHRLARISLNQVMMWSLILFLIAFFARVPWSGWAMIAAGIVFVTAFLLSRASGGAKPQQTQKRWRGQPLDLSGPTWPNRVKAFLKGRRRA